jgi:hypothetical protein
MHLPLLVAALVPLWVGALPPGDPQAITLAGSRVFVGTDQGLYRLGTAGFEPVFTRATVRDVAAGPDGVLFATGAGLFEWREQDAEACAREVGAGAEVRSVAFGPRGTAWVATEVGLFTRPRGASGFRRIRELPPAEARAVRVAGTEVWVATRGVLWVRKDERPFAPVRRGITEGWWELLDAVRQDGETLLATPFGLWKFDGERLEAIDPGVGRLRALSIAGDRLWVATERGVFPIAFPNAAPEGWPISTLPALSGETFDLAARGARLWVVTRRGLLTLSASNPPAAQGAATPGFRRASSDRDEITSVHRAVLAYLGLSPHRLHALERKARASAFWPAVRATLTADRDRARTLEHDESVTGGSLWRLRDSERGKDSALAFQLQFSWDLSRLAEPSDVLAVSRERREVVELVERVLDRVNRIYFERAQVLSHLESVPADRAEERAALVLKARELTATLEGLSGGAFSRVIDGAAERSVRSP